VTEVFFYSNVPNISEFIPRLLNKIFFLRRSAVISVMDYSILRELTKKIWGFEETSFLAHTDTKAGAAYSPFIFDDKPSVHHNDILINLKDEIPEGFSSFSRLIEIVPIEPNMRRNSRKKFSWLVERGYSIKVIDLAKGKSRDSR